MADYTGRPTWRGGPSKNTVNGLSLGLKSHGGKILGSGTSSDPYVDDTAGTKIMSFYTDCGATSGDSRGLYLRHYITGAAGGGEAARLFTTVSNVAGATAHGAHISLSFGTTGSITGLGVAGRNTLHVPNGALTGGTYAALQAEIYSDGSSSDISGATDYAFIRIANDGDATGVANVDDNANLILISGGSIASGNMVAEKTSAAVSHTIRCKVGSTTLYLMASDTQ
jgi:hypothetical protein